METAHSPYNWGATADEIRESFPCDSRVVPPDVPLFRAASVRAPPERVFRWLCQLRVAPYSYDWIDNGGRRSPRTLTPNLEQLAVGQSVMRIFRLVDFEPDRQLTLELADPAARAWFGDLAVTYAVRAAGDETRLLVKMAVRYPRSRRGRAMRLILPWGDLIMMRKQLLTLKALAERDEQQS